MVSLGALCRRALLPYVCLLSGWCQFAILLALKYVAPFRRTPAGGCVDRVLVIRTDGLGDVILTTPFLRELRSRFRSATIAVVTSFEAAGLLETCPYIDEVFIVKGQSRLLEVPWATIRRIWPV